MLNERLHTCGCNSKRVVAAFDARKKNIMVFCNDCSAFHQFNVRKPDVKLYEEYFQKQKERFNEQAPKQ